MRRWLDAGHTAIVEVVTDTRTGMPTPTGFAVSPAPTDAEAAAVIAAYEVLWPKPAVGATIAPTSRDTAWRFGSRWWALPVPVRRNRPWR